jgi:hypothetical protein
MALRQQQPPATIYGLADHLDAILAACEDLRIVSPMRSNDIATFELGALSHALQARRCLQDIWIDDDAVSHEAALFLIATGALAQLQELGYSQPRSEAVGVDQYLLGGRVPAGILADRAGDLLDALEARYGSLWTVQGDTQVVPSEQPTRLSVWSS